MAAVVPIERYEERKGLHEMGRSEEEPFTFLQRLPHEVKLEIFEVTNAAMHKSARCGGCACPEVLAVDNERGETPYLSFARYGKPVHAPADNQKI